MNTPRNPRRLLDEVMPRFDVHETHAIWAPAGPADAYAAIKAVTPAEIKLFQLLMAIRMLPDRLTGERERPRPSAPLLEQFVGQGFLILGERPAAEIVLGGAGRFWQFRGDPLVRFATPAEFVAFAEAGYAKAAVSFSVRPEGAGSRILTETRVLGTDPEATRRFRRYWFVIRPGSAAIRRSWLQAIRRRLSRATAGGLRTSDCRGRRLAMAAAESLIREVDPPADALVARALPRVDYRDAIQARITKGSLADIDAFARRLFLSQPAWLRAISTNVPSRARMAQILGATRFAAGDRIGSWRVYDRGRDEIVFGESFGFMEYRFSLRLREGAESDAVEAASVVQLSGRTGRAYFAVVRPLHQPFVRTMLRNTLWAAAHPTAGF